MEINYAVRHEPHVINGSFNFAYVEFTRQTTIGVVQIRTVRYTHISIDFHFTRRDISVRVDIG